MFRLILISSLFLSSCEEVTYTYVATLPTIQIESPPLTKINLCKFIEECGISNPRVVVAQAFLESGHLRSTLCKDNNNLFGMSVPRNRKTLATNSGSKDRWAKFKSWEASVVDYKLYQDNILRGRDLIDKEYVRLIQSKGYCEGGFEDYWNIVKSISVSKYMK